MVRPELPTASCVRRKRRPPPWTTLHLYNPPRFQLSLGDNCSDKPSHFYSHCTAQQDLQPDPVFLSCRASIILTAFNGRLRIAAGKIPSVLNEKAAAHRVKGLSQAVACRNSFCATLFISHLYFGKSACCRIFLIPTVFNFYWVSILQGSALAPKHAVSKRRVPDDDR